MKVAITGSSGLIGSALVARLRVEGHSVSRIVRPGHASSARERLINWDPEAGKLDAAALEGHDAVVHLAGESLAGLWTRSKRAKILASRVRGTNLLARALTGLRQPPTVLVSASAIGYYGDRPSDELLDEAAERGTGFLSDVVVEWEAAARQVEAAGIRIVNPRFGPVLSPKGGALPLMLPAFKLGLGARLGSGRQVWSWVGLDDVVGAIIHTLNTPSIAGPVNVVSPNAVTNAEFTDTLAEVLHRSAWMIAPAFALKLIAGDMAKEMLLSGAHVVPRKLSDTGYTFRQALLEPALRAMLS